MLNEGASLHLQPCLLVSCSQDVVPFLIPVVLQVTVVLGHVHHVPTHVLPHMLQSHHGLTGPPLIQPIEQSVKLLSYLS